MNKPTKEIKNILLAEDDDDDFYLLNTALITILGNINIFRTKNGVMLSSLLETNLKPDLIILDLNMPFKNGLLVLQEVKSAPAFADIRLIIYSTSSSWLDIDKSYENGADFYLIKPDDYKVLIDHFESLFKNPYFVNNQKPPKEHFVLK